MPVDPRRGGNVLADQAATRSAGAAGLSKVHLHAGAEAIHPAVRILTGPVETVLVQVFKLDLDGRGQVPVDAEFVAFEGPAGDSVAVQLQEVVAVSEFPRPTADAPAAVVVAGGPEDRVRPGLVAGAFAAKATVVSPVFTGQE